MESEVQIFLRKPVGRKNGQVPLLLPKKESTYLRTLQERERLLTKLPNLFELSFGGLSSCWRPFSVAPLTLSAMTFDCLSLLIFLARPHSAPKSTMNDVEKSPPPPPKPFFLNLLFFALYLVSESSSACLFFPKIECLLRFSKGVAEEMAARKEKRVESFENCS